MKEDRDSNPFLPIPFLQGPGNIFLGSVTGLPISSFGGIIFTNWVSPTATDGGWENNPNLCLSPYWSAIYIVFVLRVSKYAYLFVILGIFIILLYNV